MSQMANLTVFDGAATPVSHTLVAIEDRTLPDGTRFALWREQSAHLPREACITFTMFQKTEKSGVVVTRSRLDVPTMETTGGANSEGYTAAPKVAFHDVHELKSIRHPRSTIAGSNLALQMARNLFANVSTTVTPVVAGPVYEAHVALVFPN